ncbi:MAG: SusD/RagB family nutrient-binding outer membrane lipoprotein [Reichenbachiella sp.]
MKKYIIICLVIAVAILPSCDDYLDINVDPNNASDAPPELVFPAATLSVISVIGGDYAISGNIWSQYWTQSTSSNQYKNVDGFNLQSDFQQVRFQELYAGALNDLKFTKSKSSETENWNFYLMSTVLEVYAFQVLADLYGEIPFDDALLGNESNFASSYLGGEAVYDSLILRLDNALSKDFDAITNTDPGTADFVFGGDMDAWIQFANTLKLKLFLRNSEARPTVASQGIDALYADGVEFLLMDAAVTGFTDVANASNPLYEQDRRQLNTPNNLRASTTFVDFLQSNADPRLNVLYETPVNGGVITGLRQGDYDRPTTEIDPDDISRAVVEATDPVHFFTTAEVLFLQAEAAVRGYGTGDAKTLYDAAVMAAFDMYGFDATTFVAVGGNYEFPSGTFDQNLEAVMMQKWAAQARVNGLESWFDHLRTGYPLENTSTSTFVSGQLNYPVNGVTSNRFPRRLLYPDSEVSRNPNTPDQMDIFTSVWWDN